MRTLFSFAWRLGCAIALSVAIVLGIGALVGCKHLDPKTVADVALTAEQIACALAHAQLGQNENEVIAAVCAIPPQQLRELEKLIIGSQHADELVRRMRSLEEARRERREKRQ